MGSWGRKTLGNKEIQVKLWTSGNNNAPGMIHFHEHTILMRISNGGNSVCGAWEHSVLSW